MSAQQPDGEAVVDRYAGLVYRLPSPVPAAGTRRTRFFRRSSSAT